MGAKFGLFIILLASLNVSIQSTSQKSYGKRSVTTPFGVVRGETIIPPSEEDLPAVTQYLGIPYGVAPTGQYRFNMAISAPKWTHQPKDAFQYSPVCIQSGLPHLSEAEALKSTSSQRFDQIHRIFPHLKPQSEDCLYMNLYVPERIERRENVDAGGSHSSQLSVLVIVHGGDYGWGAGNAYNASVLAAYGQTLVVTLNYRLGIYGFLGRCESNSCTGNAGLSDLVAALKMLSNILPSFGADLSSLTLLGWGSGASLISLLMASPITQPKNRLFRRAILLDGTALSPWAMVDHSQPYFFRVANELQCVNVSAESADHFQRKISQIVRCIQEHSQQNLTAAARKIHVPSFQSAFAPIVDGQIVPNHPKFLFSPKYGALFRDIDLMIGTVSYPAHHLMSNADIESGIEMDRRDKILRYIRKKIYRILYRTLVRNLFNYHRTEIYNAIINEYTDWENPKHHPKTIRNNLLATLSDVLFTAPLVETARMHSTDEIMPKKSNTYFFLFAHETRAWTREQPFSGIRGSLSDDHIPYILGYPLSANVQKDGTQIYSGFTNDDKGISRVLMQYISNFVKSGDPSKPVPISTETTIEDRFHGTPWPQYSPETREAYLEISDRPRIKNYYRNSYVGFWNSFIPELNKNGDKESGVSEDHNLLPDHFNKHSFYGVVKPLHSFHNDPFPPPPMPPTPFPRDIKRPSASSSSATGKNATTNPQSTNVPLQPAPTPTEKPISQESRYLTLTVIIGVAFLVLNLCLFMAWAPKCFGRQRRKSMKELKYQSYTTGHPSTTDINFNISRQNSTIMGLTHQLPPPPPPPPLTSVPLGGNRNDSPQPGGSASNISPSIVNASGAFGDDDGANSLSPSSTQQKRRRRSHNFSFDAGFRPAIFYHTPQILSNPNGAKQPAFMSTSLQHHPATAQHSINSQKGANGTLTAGTSNSHGTSLNEQEPLLAANSKSSTPVGLIRPGISATCPRHGRAAQMMIAAAGNGGLSARDSIGSTAAYGLTTSTISNHPHTLEEAQV